MQCEGMFKFRGLTHVDAGSFTKPDGEVVAYKESYKLKVDELTQYGLQERVFKLAPDSNLLPVLRQLNFYDDVHLLFDVIVYASGCRVIPVGIMKDNQNEKQRNN